MPRDGVSCDLGFRRCGADGPWRPASRPPRGIRNSVECAEHVDDAEQMRPRRGGGGLRVAAEHPVDDRDVLTE
ncbi:hypothetical protein GCM10022382_30160 [Microbacterium invictum]